MNRNIQPTRPVDAETKAARRLQAAEGYLQLGLPDSALDELNHVEANGPFEAARRGLTGEALKAAHRYGEAIVHLRAAIDMIPAPLTQPVWRSLAECYAAQGDAAASQDCLAHAEQLATDKTEFDRKFQALVERMLKKYGPRLAALAKAHHLPTVTLTLVINNAISGNTPQPEPESDNEPGPDDFGSGSD
jgi:tetratricopeptide (TPR) repeat protein